MEPSKLTAEMKRCWGKIIEPKVLVAECSFRIVDVSMEIDVRVYYCPDTVEPYWFDTSHYVWTPTQAGPYTTSAPFASTVEMAVYKAVETIRTFYEEAVSLGHKPDKAWFVPNESW